MNPGSINRGGVANGFTPLVGSQEMAGIDLEAQNAYSIPGLVLMENAGAQAWQLLRDRYLLPGEPRTVLFVAGRGNNGGDALVMARHCAVEEVHRPVVLVTSCELREPGAGHLSACVALGVPVIDWSLESAEAEAAIGQADWIVDGIAGTGMSGELSADIAELTTAINRSGTPVAAIDCPTGVGDRYRSGYPAITARVTLTMGLPKRCLYFPITRTKCGTVEVVPVGFPPALLKQAGGGWNLVDESALSSLLPPMDRSMYKGSRGLIAVFAGAPGTSGAAVLCVQAAARSGAGMVRLYVDPAVYPLVAAQLVSVMVVSTRDSMDFGRATALVIGSGWGVEPARDGQLLALLESGLPGVIDADGIAIISRLRAAGRLPGLAGRWVLTPHIGEFAGLCGIRAADLPEDPSELLLEWSERLDAVIVLKGHVTWIGTPSGAVSVIDGMNPALGTGGSGDVLAGVIGAQLGRGSPAKRAAEAGVVLHQVVGRRLFQQRGFFLAEDMPELLSIVSAEHTRVSG